MTAGEMLDDSDDRDARRSREKEAYDYFYGEGFVTALLTPLKSGKEASVWLCRANPDTGYGLLAMKVHRAPEHRQFRNDAVYRSGRVITNARNRRAVEGKTRFGRTVASALWLGAEHEALARLHAAGASVPKPVASSDAAILMEYIGDEEGPAPQLRSLRLDLRDARTAFEQVMADVELMLVNDVVHGDLSPFNVLWWEGRARVIDLPQWVDPRFNRNAEDLLERDVETMCAYFARLGVRSNPSSIVSDLWIRYRFARL